MESVQTFFKNLYARIEAYVRANPRRTAIILAVVFLLIMSFIIRPAPPHVELRGEQLLTRGPWWFTNSVLTTLIVDVILIVLAVAATARMSLVPRGWQNFMEAVIEYLYNLSESVAHHNARKFFPWVATIFLFVIISNWSGLIPGVGSIGFLHEGGHAAIEGGHALVEKPTLVMANGNLMIADRAAEVARSAAAEPGYATLVPLFRPPSADLNVTFALALVTMTMVQVWGIQALGAGYFRKFFNISGHGFMRGINGFVGILELISEFSRILAFGFRLFGNIFAGEIVLATMAFLIPFLIPIPFYVLEIFIGFVQALVFMMLALVFFTIATISHGHEEHH
jgi:F-type H+-transporting ATPase subunit a